MSVPASPYDDEDFALPSLGGAGTPSSGDDLICSAMATGKTRTRCKEWALPGFDHCVEHLPREEIDPSELADQTRLHTALKLLRLVPRAVTTLEQVMDDADAPAGVRAKAAESLLDRAGYRTGIDIHISGEVEVNPSDLIAERLAKLGVGSGVAAAIAARTTGSLEPDSEDPDSEITDVEVIEEEPVDEPTDPVVEVDEGATGSTSIPAEIDEEGISFSDF